MRHLARFFGLTVFIWGVLDSSSAFAVDLNEELIKKVRMGNIYSIQNLLAKGADANVRINTRGTTALMYAAANDYVDIVDLLLAKGADVNATDDDGATALMLVAVARGNATRSFSTGQGVTTIVVARNNQSAIVQALLAKGADVDLKDSDLGSTALMHALANGNIKIAHILLAKGADVNVKSNNGITALMLAAWKGHIDIAQSLVAKGADVNAKSNDGITVLMVAAKNGHNSIVELLKKGGAKE